MDEEDLKRLETLIVAPCHSLKHSVATGNKLRNVVRDLIAALREARKERDELAAQECDFAPVPGCCCDTCTKRGNNTTQGET